MDSFPTISLGDALALLHRRPGLLLGPGATRAPGELSQILKHAAQAAKLGDTTSIEEDNYGIYVDKVRSERGDKSVQFESNFRDGILSLKPAPDINHLARALWSACISATEDITFEAALRTYLDSIPGSRSLTIVDGIRVSSPSRTIPVYKLLGNLMNQDPEATLVLSEGDLLLRQHIWRDLLSSFPDHVRDAPVFVIGLANRLSLARSILGAIQSMPHPRPSQLLFLKNDTTLSDPTIAQLCKRFNTSIVDASLKEISAGISSHKPPVLIATSLVVPPALKDFATLVAKHVGVVVLTPGSKDISAMNPMELPSIVEALFRPAAIDWRPFQHGIDVRRSITSKLTGAIEQLSKESVGNSTRTVLLRGEAGIGKTTLLKRVALEASDKGLICLWCTRSSTGNALRGLKALVSDLTEWVKVQKAAIPKFVVFCDDPWGLRIDVADLLSAFNSFPASLVFVHAVRNSDYGTDAHSVFNAISVDADYEIPYDLDSEEMNGLSNTLVKIGAVTDLTMAQREISRVPTRHASDILCNLWYLIPETRLQFAESLRDEYCRLGSVKDAVSSIAQTAVAENGAIAHGAYEFVTVTSNLNIGLPVEVLVHALGVDYSEWLDTVGTGRPLWGLLYDVQDAESESVTYFTRNEIVTRLLLELVNGAIGHAGEFRVLKRLLSACTGGAIVYRTFVINVLVRGRKRLATFLTYDQGIELYDAAIEALPFEDRVIQHHRGIWMQDVGNDDGLAYRQFEKALLTEIYPGADRDAPKEHIHTSMAAATLKLIKNNELDLERGMLVIKEHLRQASGSRFFNPHTSHVSANLLFEIAKLSGFTSPDGDGLSYVVSSLQEIERARQIVAGRREIRFIKDLEMMADLEKRVLSTIPDSARLVRMAFEIFQRSKSQIGLEAAARRLLVEASATSKGKDFNEVNDFLNECMEVLEAASLQPTADLLNVRIDLMIRWQLLAFRPVNWEAMRDDIADVLSDPRYRDDIMRTFYYAVCLFHCSDITEANAVFATLRRWQPAAFGLREIRCFFLGPDGDPKRFQGIFKSEYHRWHFEISDLNVALLSRRPSNYGSGATGHGYISFSLNGPLVQEERPEKSDLVLW